MPWPAPATPSTPACGTPGGRNATQVTAAAAVRREHEAVDLRTVDLDVTSEESVEAAVAAILAEQGHLDVLVHNAGHMVTGPAEAFTPEQLAELYDVNVLGTQRLNRAVLPHLRARQERAARLGGQLQHPGWHSALPRAVLRRQGGDGLARRQLRRRTGPLRHRDVDRRAGGVHPRHEPLRQRWPSRRRGGRDRVRPALPRADGAGRPTTGRAGTRRRRRCGGGPGHRRTWSTRRPGSVRSGCTSTPRTTGPRSVNAVARPDPGRIPDVGSASRTCSCRTGRPADDRSCRRCGTRPDPAGRLPIAAGSGARQLPVRPDSFRVVVGRTPGAAEPSTPASPRSPARVWRRDVRGLATGHYRAVVAG